ncbi:TetR/AcrR family transcriptional regulator [Duganella callida]|uniref:TetR/AcrR family transcriptional regulator n=2 Tax=Duganella callida TaxID=2561932 RepID=A0A4Y9SK12_9BURK|nr:TetR/AcrR family transcriptional regulator [Duganella callida]
MAAFTDYGYDGVGVRDIAQGAGVTAMLVNRYFGSKEGLFAEAVDAALAEKGILTDAMLNNERGTDELAHDIAAALVAQTAPAAPVLSGFLILLRSAGNARAAEILRDKVERHFEAPLTRLLPGIHPAQRAALLLSLIAGFQLMRQVMGNRALTAADGALLTAQLTAQLKLLMSA